MPRYFFHFRDGQTLPDQNGTDLPDFQAARVEAVRQSGEALKWHAETFWNEGKWSLDVTDGTGLTLFTLHFLAISAPAIRRREARPST